MPHDWPAALHEHETEQSGETPVTWPFPKRKAAWDALMTVIRELPDLRMQLRLINAASNYGQAAASEMQEHMTEAWRKAVTKPVAKEMV